MQVRAAPGHTRSANEIPPPEWENATSAQIPKQLLIAMAHPTRFERVASAFGGITGSSVEITKEREKMHYHTANKKEFEASFSRSYPFLRHDFRPTAYVVLTRVEATGLENLHG